MNESISGNKKCQSIFEIENIQRDINTIVTGVELCKQKIANPTWYGHVEPVVQNTIENFFDHVISRINVGLHMFLKRLNEEMVADLRYFNSLESEVDSLTSQLETQKTQFVNEIDRYYYADHMNAILGVYTKLDEVTNLHCDYLELLQKCECLETELSKSKKMSKSFESVQKHAINLELKLQQCKEKVKNDMSFKVNKSKEFCKERDQYFKIQDLKAQLQDKIISISKLKKLIEKLKGKYVDTKFEKSSVIRQPNAFKSPRPSVLGKPTTFSNSFIRNDFSKSTSVTKNNVSHDFSKSVTTQTLPTKKKSCLKNTNMLAPGMYKIHTDHTQARTSKLPQDSKKTNKSVSFSTGVIPTTSVSRPQLKSNPKGDRVLRSNSHGKKLEVEEHRRNVKLSKNKMPVAACTDNFNAKTVNVKSVSAMNVKLSKNKMPVTACTDNFNAKTVNVKSVSTICAKSVMITKHDLRVPKYVAKPLRKPVASESIKEPRNNVRKLNERFGKIYKWTYIKFTPSGYMWKPKSKRANVNQNKFLGTVKFRNDQIAPILRYGDLVQGAVTIKRVYYVEGLNHNLFSVGQFCDADLEVAFRKSACFIRDLKGNDLLTGSRGTDLYSISLQSTNSPNPIC
uniref:Integrase, catalytic region, zinc finger, CCHC-type, peptidase aspartic, catalytic n=1 Tax=Tanacetum cinerariifolium TaxID=118510 RepID=A0A699KUQ5_TANCI|nr:integrase, catalytic region, zinc finger, CCHC-type, peptidase aspartic, catalytic [Tanacetum cinerariifolium]